MSATPERSVLSQYTQVASSAPVTQKRRQKSKQKRYNLVLPEELFGKLQELADERQTTVVDLLRRFIKLGLIAAEIEEASDSALLIKEGGIEREIVLI